MSERKSEIKPDFVAHFGSMSTVWTIVAESAAAKEFAEENFPVEDWQGVPTRFSTDWRPARDLCRQLANDGWTVCCKQPDREGYGVMEAD